MWRFSFLCLVALFFSGCSSQTPVSSKTTDNPFQAAMGEARKWEGKKIWGLAEAGVRKALAIDSTNLEARQLLFVVLANQPESSEATKEAMGLAKDLMSTCEKGSPEYKKLVAYQDAEASKRIWSELTQAVKEKKPNAEQLLQQIPESQRNEEYWRMAFEIRKDSPDLKIRMESSRQWLKFHPKGIEARTAAKEFLRHQLQQASSAKTAFQLLVEADPSDRAIFTFGDKRRLEALDTILAESKILEAKEAKDGHLNVTISFVDPYLKKPVKETLILAYEKPRQTYILDSNKSDFGTSMTLLGNPAHAIAPDLSGVEGVFDASTITDLAPLEKALGAGRTGTSKVSFDNGTLIAEVDKSSSRLTSIIVSGSTYRTREGLGVGSSLKEFAAHYKVEESILVRMIKKLNQANNPDSPPDDVGLVDANSQQEAQLYDVYCRQPGGSMIMILSDTNGLVRNVVFPL